MSEPTGPARDGEDAPVLEVSELGVSFPTPLGTKRLFEGVNFTLRRGESVGLVGASGSGKSTLGSALLRLLPRQARLHSKASVRLAGTEILKLEGDALRAVRGRRIAMVFQEPMQALHPAIPVGKQLTEALRVHRLATRREARDRMRAMLARIGFGDTKRTARRYAHEFSGGMRQRLLVAAALLPKPDILIADEPTTALDATIQAQVLDLIDELRAEAGTALLLISHDADVIGERCPRVLRLERGRVEEDAMPLAHARSALRHTSTASNTPLLRIEGLDVRYRDRRSGFFGFGEREVHAVAGVDLVVHRGETLAIVGESGSGKSSLAHAILRLVPSRGRVVLDGVDLTALGGERLRRQRQRFQLVPQDAGASLTPHMSVEDLVLEGIEVHRLVSETTAIKRARALLEEVGLPPAQHGARPAALSTGERQRVAIARALATRPDILVCDEPVASVDAPLRDRLLELLERIQRDRGLALVLISHDLGAVRRLADRIAVMYAGRVVEHGLAGDVLRAPRMPYTRALLAAVPTGDPAALKTRLRLAGEAAPMGAVPAGCAFHPRCPHPAKDAQCLAEAPPLAARDGRHLVACWKAGLPSGNE